MEVLLMVPRGTDVSVIEKEYPGLWEGTLSEDDEDQSYWIGKPIADSEDCEDGEEEWMSYDEAAEFCGFCRGAIKSACTNIEGNCSWSQSMITRRDFSDYAVTEEEKKCWKETSDRYWKGYERGKKAALAYAGNQVQK